MKGLKCHQYIVNNKSRRKESTLGIEHNMWKNHFHPIDQHFSNKFITYIA